MHYRVIVGEAASPQERAAIDVFVDRLALRSGGPVETAGNGAAAGGGDDVVSVRAGTPDSSEIIRRAAAEGSLELPPDLGDEGYVIAVDDEGPIVAALGQRGVLYGLGALLRTGVYDGDGWRMHPVPVTSSPRMSQRAIYFATHFGNWLVHCPVDELVTYVEDVALWGANEVLTWFDTAELASLDAGREQAERLAEVDRAARRLGLRVARIMVSNEGYLGQAPAELRSKNVNHRHSPKTDLCPSEPEARAMILANKREYLQELPSLDMVWLWPYDHGGCNCEGCAPWPRTYFELNRELAEIVGDTHPQADIGASAWWIDLWHPGEKQAFFDGLATSGDWCSALTWSERETTRWGPEPDMPEGMRFVFFPEISMFESFNKIGIPWGGKGANPAPRRFAAQFAQHAPFMDGFMSYSEGRYDDLNKVIWTQLAWDPDQDVADIVAAYGRYELGAGDGGQVADLVLALEPVLLGRSRDPSLDGEAAAIAGAIPPWGSAAWRWQMLRASTELHGLRESLYGPHAVEGAQRAEAEQRHREVWDHLQLELYLHRPGATRDPNLYVPVERLATDFHQRRTVGAIPLEDELFGPLLGEAREVKAQDSVMYGSDQE